MHSEVNIFTYWFSWGIVTRRFIVFNIAILLRGIGIWRLILSNNALFLSHICSDTKRQEANFLCGITFCSVLCVLFKGFLTGFIQNFRVLSLVCYMCKQN